MAVFKLVGVKMVWPRSERDSRAFGRLDNAIGGYGRRVGSQVDTPHEIRTPAACDYLKNSFIGAAVALAPG